MMSSAERLVERWWGRFVALDSARVTWTGSGDDARANVQRSSVHFRVRRAKLDQG